MVVSLNIDSTVYVCSSILQCSHPNPNLLHSPVCLLISSPHASASCFRGVGNADIHHSVQVYSIILKHEQPPISSTGPCSGWWEDKLVSTTSGDNMLQNCNICHFLKAYVCITILILRSHLYSMIRKIPWYKTLEGKKPKP